MSGIRVAYINLDNEYRANRAPIVINNLRLDTTGDVEDLNQQLITVYNKDYIDTVPCCACGELKGNYRIGKHCDTCNTEVAKPNSDKSPLLWAKKLHGLDKFLNPSFWLDFNKIMVKKLDLLRWLSDTSYNPPVDIPPYFHEIADRMGGRDYNRMVENMDIVFDVLKTVPAYKNTAKLPKLLGLEKLYNEDRKNLFSEYLPIMNKSLFVIENTNKGKFTNFAVGDIITIVISYIRKSNDMDLSYRNKSNLMGSILSGSAQLYNKYIDTFLRKKGGLFRKNLFGARSSGTFRGVITSIIGPSRYDEIHVPWSIAVTAFRPQLMSLLLNRYKVKALEASELLFGCTHKYDALVSECLDVLLEESFTPGSIPVLGQRNPSLLPGSAQLLRITKFIKDPKIKTIAISVLSVKPFNADFDGDELNYTICQDKEMYDNMKGFAPHFNGTELGNPFEVSGNLNLLGPATGIMTNWLRDGDLIKVEDTISAKLTPIV